MLCYVFQLVANFVFSVGWYRQMVYSGFFKVKNSFWKKNTCGNSETEPKQIRFWLLYQRRELKDAKKLHRAEGNHRVR